LTLAFTDAGGSGCLDTVGFMDLRVMSEQGKPDL